MEVKVRNEGCCRLTRINFILNNVRTYRDVLFTDDVSQQEQLLTKKKVIKKKVNENASFFN